MATTKLSEFDVESAKAAENLSTHQFKLVKLNSSGELVKATAGDLGFALTDKPISGQFGTYVVTGRAKAVAKEAFNAGEVLSSNSEGKLVKATATKVEEEKVKALGTKVVGVALQAAAAEGDIVAFRATATGARA